LDLFGAQRLAGKPLAVLDLNNILHEIVNPDFKPIFAAALASRLDPRVGRFY
jgi:hypothetical protein